MAAIVASLALPCAASAEYLVPPSNSAANQYTETVPTAGGQRDAENRRGGRSSTPAEVLGANTARRLGEHGDEGREVADLAAETAPVTEAEPPAEEGSTPPSDEDPSRSEDASDQDRDRGDDSAAPGAGGPGRGAPGAAGDAVEVASDGSSGLGEVVSEATGLSSSGLLPLAILATLAWALAFLWRQRQRPTA